MPLTQSANAKFKDVSEFQSNLCSIDIAAVQEKYPLPKGENPTMALAFDMDGTVFGTEEDINYPIFKKMGKMYGVDINEERWTELKGMGITHLHKVMCEEGNNFNLTLDDYKNKFLSLRDEKIAELIESGEEPIKFLPGVRETLLLYRELGIPSIIVTSALRPEAMENLEKLGVLHLFAGVKTIDDVPPELKKPDPFPYISALEDIDIIPNKTVYGLEDSTPGIQSVISAGLKSVLFTSDGRKPDPRATVNTHHNEFFERMVAHASHTFGVTKVQEALNDLAQNDWNDYATPREGDDMKNKYLTHAASQKQKEWMALAGVLNFFSHRSEAANDPFEPTYEPENLQVA